MALVYVGFRPGDTSWTVPGGVTSVDVYALAPGGNGNVGTGAQSGGGGGAFSIKLGLSVSGTVAPRS